MLEQAVWRAYGCLDLHLDQQLAPQCFTAAFEQKSLPLNSVVLTQLKSFVPVQFQ